MKQSATTPLTRSKSNTPLSAREQRLQNRSSNSNTPTATTNEEDPVNFDIPSGQPEIPFPHPGYTTPKSFSSNSQKHQQKRTSTSSSSSSSSCPPQVPLHNPQRQITLPLSRGARTLRRAQQDLTTRESQRTAQAPTLPSQHVIVEEQHDNRMHPKNAHEDDSSNDSDEDETRLEKESHQEDDDVDTILDMHRENRQEHEHENVNENEMQTHRENAEEEEVEEEEKDKEEEEEKDKEEEKEEEEKEEEEEEKEEEEEEEQQDDDYGDNVEKDDDDYRDQEEEEEDDDDDDDNHSRRQRKKRQTKGNEDPLFCCRQMIFKLKFGHVWVHEFRRRLLNAGRKFLTSIHFLCIMPGRTKRIVQMSCRVCTTKTVYYCVGCSSGMEEHLADDHQQEDSAALDACFTKQASAQYGYNSKGKPFTRQERLLLVRRNEIVPICLGNNGACFQFYHRGIDSPIRHPSSFSQEEYDYMTKRREDLCYPISTSGTHIQNDRRQRRRKTTTA